MQINQVRFPLCRLILFLILCVPADIVLCQGAAFLVKDVIGPESSVYGSAPNYFKFVGGITFFTASDLVHGLELWKTDGTPAGTQLVKDIRPGRDGSEPLEFADFNGKLIFSANDGSSGHEIWLSDGTAAGTVMIKDINPGMEESDPLQFAVVNDVVLFSATSPNSGFELWETDGTTAGTVQVLDIYPGPDSSGPSYCVAMNGVAYFSATTESSGPGPIRTDLLRSVMSCSSLLMRNLQVWSYGRPMARKAELNS